MLTLLGEKLKRSLWIGTLGYGLNVLAVFIWLKQRGKRQMRQKYIKGDYLSQAKGIKKMIRRADQSDLVIGIEKLPLPRFSEMQHCLFHGTTGSGKSTGIKFY